SPPWRTAPAEVCKVSRSMRRKRIGWPSRKASELRSALVRRPKPLEARPIGGVEAHSQPVSALDDLLGQNVAARVKPCHRLALIKAQEHAGHFVPRRKVCCH